MTNVEFYMYNNELWLISDGVNKVVAETDVELISKMINRIMHLYPEAYKALAEEYKNSLLNVPYYQYLIVRRFCKCNFGNLDNTRKDVDIRGNYNIEHVSCPLRGECKHEGIICNPKLDTRLSDSEMRVMKLLYEGKTPAETASMLYLSPDTVKTHYKTVYKKLDIHGGLPEFIRYASKNNLFE